jgi:hypothetical protein
MSFLTYLIAGTDFIAGTEKSMGSLAIVARPHKSCPLGHALNLERLRGRRFVPNRPRNLFGAVAYFMIVCIGSINIDFIFAAGR